MAGVAVWAAYSAPVDRCQQLGAAPSPARLRHPAPEFRRRVISPLSTLPFAAAGAFRSVADPGAHPGASGQGLHDLGAVSTEEVACGDLAVTAPGLSQRRHNRCYDKHPFQRREAQ